MATTIRISAILAFAAWTATPGAVAAGDARVRAYVDADTANEVDDPYAIFRALVAPEFEVVGLSSAGWKTDDFAAATRASQKMNEEVLTLLGLSRSIPHPLGALSRMPDRSTPVDSPAARDIIARARETPAGQKLHIFVLGCYTNVASALLIDPGIKGRVAVYAMGYNYRDGRLATDEFNCEGDPNAATSLLGSGVDLHLMPASVLRDFWWDKSAVDDHFKGRGGIKDYLVARWEAVAPRDGRRILWDIAVFEAYLRPGSAKLETIDRDGAKVRVWVEVDKEAMQSDYWAETGRDPARR